MALVGFHTRLPPLVVFAVLASASQLAAPHHPRTRAQRATTALPLQVVLHRIFASRATTVPRARARSCSTHAPWAPGLRAAPPLRALRHAQHALLAIVCLLAAPLPMQISVRLATTAPASRVAQIRRPVLLAITALRVRAPQPRTPVLLAFTVVVAPRIRRCRTASPAVLAFVWRWRAPLPPQTLALQATIAQLRQLIRSRIPALPALTAPQALLRPPVAPWALIRLAERPQ